ncbi:MAG: hypothetical protein ACPL2N_07170 [Candidatus Cryosericum sp.]
MKRRLSPGSILFIAIIVESIAALAFMGIQGYRLLSLTRKLSGETTQLAQENQKLDAVLALQSQIAKDKKTLAEQQASGAQVGTDKDLVVFVEKMDTLAHSSGLSWDNFTYQGFTAVATAGSGYPPNLKSASFILSAKGTWTQFLTFVDKLEQYPGVVSLGTPLDLPFLGGVREAQTVQIPINFYMSSTNDPSWMIEKAGAMTLVPPAGTQTAPPTPSAVPGAQ